MPELTLRSIDIDLAANTLRLALTEPDAEQATTTVEAEATIDIGTGGRLMGVELPDLYVDVMPPEPGTEHLIRSATATIGIERAGEGATPCALVIPRRGDGYEITYPSGNQ